MSTELTAFVDLNAIISNTWLNVSSREAQSSFVQEMRMRLTHNKLHNKENLIALLKSGPAKAGLAGPAVAPLMTEVPFLCQIPSNVITSLTLHKEVG